MAYNQDIEHLIKEVNLSLTALRDATQVAFEKGDFAPETRPIARQLVRQIYNKAITDFAWWKDGIERVGSGVYTLEEGKLKKEE